MFLSRFNLTEEKSSDATLARSLLRGKMIDLLLIFLGGTFLLLSIALTWALGFIQQHKIGIPLDLGPFFSFFLRYLLPFLQDAGEEDPVFLGLFLLDLKGGIMITASVSING